MDKSRESWRDTLRAVGEALVDLLRAEAAVVGETWKRSGRELRTIAMLGVVAAYLALICLPTLLIFALLMGLVAGLGWPFWGASLTVAGVVALIVLMLVAMIRRRFSRRLESPAATLRTRYVDHRAWWNERIAGDDQEAVGAMTDTSAADTSAADTSAADAPAAETARRPEESADEGGDGEATDTRS